MYKRTTPQIFGRAKQLHRNMPPAERKLWAALRAHRTNDIHFRNQHAIGNYIVDFCAPSRKLIIEVDGDQHVDQQGYDQERTAFLQSKGYKVLRFWNNDILNNLNGVMQVILEAVEVTDPILASPKSPRTGNLGEGN
jgi:very-short-patch-repair endonuclease